MTDSPITPLPSPRQISILKSAIADQENGNLQSAKDAYLTLVRSGANMPEAYANLALISHHQGQLELAISLLCEALKLDNGNINYSLQLAAMHKEFDDLPAAVETYKKALCIDGQSLPALYNLANIQQQLERHDEAAENYRHVIELNPNFVEAHYNLGRSEATLGHLENAVHAYRLAISLRPDYAQAHSNLGNALRDKGDLDGAITSYYQALEAAPDYSPAHYNLGNALYEAGEFAEAAPHFDRAKIGDWDARSLFCCYKTGQFEAFERRLPPLLAKQNRSPLIAALVGHYATNFNRENSYNFCKHPLDFIYHERIESLARENSQLRYSLLELFDLSEISSRKQGRLVNGIQSSGNLFTRKESPVIELATLVKNHLATYYERFSQQQCELIQAFPHKLSFESAWYIGMRQGGHLSSHIHETGWISGVLYLALPSDKGKGEEGNIEFSLHGDDFPTLHDNFPSCVLPVEVGDIVLFPSSLFHRTLPFQSDEDRICIAFDLSPT